MLNFKIENDIIRLREIAKDNLQKRLNNMIYFDKIESILSDYLEFLKVGIAFGLINYSMIVLKNSPPNKEKAHNIKHYELTILHRKTHI